MSLIQGSMRLPPQALATSPPMSPRPTNTGYSCPPATAQTSFVPAGAVPVPGVGDAEHGRHGVGVGEVSVAGHEIGDEVGGVQLVGTFLGILVAYGFIGPISTAMEHRANEEGGRSTITGRVERAFLGGDAAIMVPHTSDGRRAMMRSLF